MKYNRNHGTDQLRVQQYSNNIKYTLTAYDSNNNNIVYE